jgi:hypothetical protein
MSRASLSLLALALGSSLAAVPAQAAQGTPDLQQIQEEIKQLKASYEARIQALEKRLAEMQQNQAAAAAAPAVAVAPPPAPLPPPEPVAASAPAGGGIAAYNPSMSLILNGTFANLAHNPDNYKLQGFIPSGGDGVGPGPRGFSLGESELSLAANIDPTFSGHLTFSLTGDDKVSVEEAVFERQSFLADGVSLKGGRFLSSWGYLNSQHAHAWDFVDAPLVYQAFFGGQSKTDGVQLRWLAPSDKFIELGLELGAGRGFPGSDTGRNSAGSTALFAHLGDDIGNDASYRLGLSYLRFNANDRPYGDVNANGQAVTNSFTGDSSLWAVDGIYKWAPGGNNTRTNFKLQGEYFRRTENGSLAYDTTGANLSNGYNSVQSGWYLQAVYQFMPLWRVGMRYDRLDSGTPTLGRTAAFTLADLPLLQAATPNRSTLMLDYSPSEFSRFRLQWANDQSNPAGGNDRQIFLQYIMSLGAHGAHAF